MTNQMFENVVSFPREYLIEQRQQDRWFAIASCSIVLGSDEPMASVEMILDQYGDAPNKPNAADIIFHARFAARTLPDALIDPDDLREAGLATTERVRTETVFNEWIDAWLPKHQC